MTKHHTLIAAAVFATAGVGALAAQGAGVGRAGGAGAGGAAQGPARGGGGGGATYPAQQRQLAAPEVIARGKIIYNINCTSCHGADARGGDQGGPNLLRSSVVLNDQHGELIAPIVHGDRADKGMDPINLSDADTTAVAEFIHSLAAAGRGRGSVEALNVLVGNAAAGQAAFAAKCGACHSVTGDLKGIGARMSDAMTLQNFWISGGGGGGRGGGGGAATPTGAARPTTVTVTLPSGQKVEGRLARMDDFLVSLVDAGGSTRSFVRDGDRPKVEVHNPLEPHIALLPKYADTEIHDITAYLVTIK